MKLKDKTSENPHFIFLIDGIGALITSFCLLLVLPNLSQAFYMPSNILYFLGTIAILFAAYSLSNYFAKLNQIKLLIRIIAFANLSYCLFTGFIVLQLSSQISVLDIVYFSGEILVVTILAMFELKLASNLDS